MRVQLFMARIKHEIMAHKMTFFDITVIIHAYWSTLNIQNEKHICKRQAQCDKSQSENCLQIYELIKKAKSL